MTKRPSKRSMVHLHRIKIERIARPEIIAMMVKDLSRFAGKNETLQDDVFAYAAEIMESAGLQVGRRHLAEYAASIAAYFPSVIDPSQFTEWAARLWLERQKKA